MTDGGWPYETSPFHRGEQEVQVRLGARETVEGVGRRFIHDHLPEQHRKFYRMLPFLIVGTIDEQGRPWASILAGSPGFISSPAANRLSIAARPLAGDPLNWTLRDGAPVGILGIWLETRRRNRLNGRVSRLTADAFEVVVDQAFGNCPQYIQTRTVIAPAGDGDGDGDAAQPPPIHRGVRLDDAARDLIERSDTLFIATAAGDGTDDRTGGADVSHRGGKPGFVCVEDDQTLVFPDYSGNLHFNTIGNIVLNPKAGLLFIDFDRGDLVYASCAADIVWDGEEVRAFAGAERLLRFRVEDVIRVKNSLPLRFSFGEYSPSLEATGTWRQAVETIAADRARNTYLRYDVTSVETESETISSFHVRRADGKALASFRAGQFLPIRLSIPGRPEPVYRTYTVSCAPNAEHYRLSIKREGTTGVVSNFFHDHVRPGYCLEAIAPRGTFVLDPPSERPVVLISGGIGITPMIAITDELINEGRRTRDFRKIYFIHGTTNRRTLAFGRHLRALARVHPSLTVHLRFSRPEADDALGETHDSVGHVDIDLIKSVLPFDDYDFYLCGPGGFMQSLYTALTGLGVRDERIHYESFGPASVLVTGRKPPTLASAADIAEGPVSVRFAASGIEAQWSPDKGTLLDLALSAGLSPTFGCRSGICGTCATRISCGAVDYIEEPVGPRADNEVLICCSTPRPTPKSTTGAATCGSDHGVVLEL
jgi:uncharacterized protein